jgi:DNA-binding MarR family transcriptional regulator
VSTDAPRDAGPVLDPDIFTVMKLCMTLQRAATRAVRDIRRRRKVSERGIYIIEMVNAGLDQPRRLIDYFGVLPSTITFETDKLVAAGLLERAADAGDRRVVRLRLTEKGAAVHRETTAALTTWFRPPFDQLDQAELATFVALFRKLTEPLRLDRKRTRAAGPAPGREPANSP